MECVGDTLQELGPLLSLVGAELRAQPAVQLQAAEALGSALMLRYAELALHMSDSYGTDEEHRETDGVLRGEMLRRLVENLEDVRRFCAEQEPRLRLEALQERLQRAVRAKWLGEAAVGASPFRTRGEAAKAKQEEKSKTAQLSKGMGQLGSKMSMFASSAAAKMEKAAQEAREKNAELQRQRAERAAERDAAERAAAATALPPMAAPPPPPPPPPPPQGAPKKKKATLGAALAD